MPNFTALDPNTCSPHWMEVHATGCADIHRHGHAPHWTFDADTLEDIAEEVASDFIAEGSMTVAEALQHVHFAPCVKVGHRSTHKPIVTQDADGAYLVACTGCDVVAEAWYPTAALVAAHQVRLHDDPGRRVA